MSKTQTTAPPVAGILETVLYLDDLVAARAFYRDLLGLREIFDDHRMLGYDVCGRGVLLVFERGSTLETVEMPGGTIPPHDGHGPAHMAFQIPADALESWKRRLEDSGVAIEGRTRWPRGGHSIYFRDPSGNLIEMATPGLWPGY